jgi:hypothetical protein
MGTAMGTGMGTRILTCQIPVVVVTDLLDQQGKGGESFYS